MDIPPKQFTAAVNILKWKLARIVSHLQSLDRQVGAISSDGEARENEWKTNPPTLTAILQEKESVISERESQNTRREQREIAAAVRDRNRLRIEAAGIIIAGVLAGLTWQSVIVARIAANAAQQSAHASADQAAAARAQAEAARSQTETAQRAAENTLDTFRQDQRAWITPVAQGPDFGANTIGVSLPNTGKTPARRVEGKIECQITMPTEQPDFSYKLGTTVNSGLVFPGVPNAVPVAIVSTVIPGHKGTVYYDQGLADILRNGKMEMVTFGRINYTDVFGVQHFVQFCGYFNPLTPKEITARCAAYNDAN